MTKNLEERKILLMGFMDGELSPEEMTRINDALMRDAALREEYEALCRACGKLERMQFYTPDEEELKRLWKSPLSSLATRLAWALIFAGVAVLGAHVLYALFFLSDEEPLLSFSMIGVFVGFAILMGLKIRDRVVMYSKDPYRDIEK